MKVPSSLMRRLLRLEKIAAEVKRMKKCRRKIEVVFWKPEFSLENPSVMIGATDVKHLVIPIQQPTLKSLFRKGRRF